MPSSQTLLEVLAKSLKILDGVEIFPFFGTLLGLERAGAPIDGDDDVDLYADVKIYEKVLSVLSNSSEAFVFRTGLRSTYLQFRLEEFPEVPIDIYFFQTRASHLVEKWNFAGLPALPIMWLRVPSRMVFPLKEVSLPLNQMKIKVPQQSDAICSFLYGSDWRVPKQKGVDYKTVVFLGAPVTLRGWPARAMSRLVRSIRRDQKHSANESHSSN